MADTPWTPGPWVIGRDHNGVRRIFAGHDGPQVATASVFANWMPVEQKKFAHATADANARLIAAAPDMAEALAALLRRDEINTCQHEETHRGGFLWEICDQCGAKWADDEGGKPEWVDPPEWKAARDALAKARGEQ